MHKLARFCGQVTPEDKGKATRLHSQEKKLGLGTQIVMLSTRHEASKISLLKIRLYAVMVCANAEVSQVGRFGRNWT